MNETEWLASRDAGAMLRHLGVGAAVSDRKLRLFAVACCRVAACRNAPRRGDPESFLAALEAHEQYADGAALDHAAGRWTHPEWDAAAFARWASRGLGGAADLLREVVGDPFGRRPPPWSRG